MASRKQSDMIDRANAAQMQSTPPLRGAYKPRFNYGVLSMRELVNLGELDPRYGRDPLFTELVKRLTLIISPPKER